MADVVPKSECRIKMPTPIHQLLQRIEAEGFKVQIRGGWVRDTLMDRYATPADVDIVTDIPRGELRSFMHTKCRAKLWESPYSYASSSVWVKGLKFDFTHVKPGEALYSAGVDYNWNALFCDKHGIIRNRHGRLYPRQRLKNIPELELISDKLSHILVLRGFKLLGKYGMPLADATQKRWCEIIDQPEPNPDERAHAFIYLLDALSKQGESLLDYIVSYDFFKMLAPIANAVYRENGGFAYGWLREQLANPYLRQSKAQVLSLLMIPLCMQDGSTANFLNDLDYYFGVNPYSLNQPKLVGEAEYLCRQSIYQTIQATEAFSVMNDAPVGSFTP